MLVRFGRADGNAMMWDGYGRPRDGIENGNGGG